ncbi:MAG: hypothetical protein ABH876_01270 [Patescibacteria group bacterium]|nr:hypothetical protein [Patescibacteria group bacterium]MBU1877287.1 hypothetical protein [Patescibacteria group bacterium]
MRKINTDEKGKIAEQKTFDALEKIEKDGNIKSFGWTFPFSEDDLRGIDFIIFPNKGREIRIQVKSSYNQKEEERYSRRGIYYMVVQPYKTREKVKLELLQILEIAMERWKQRKNNFPLKQYLAGFFILKKDGQDVVLTNSRW